MPAAIRSRPALPTGAFGGTKRHIDRPYGIEMH
jgi:hypothetical protein